MKDMNANILVIEDEQAISEMIEVILQAEGIENITICHTYIEALQKISLKSYDFYIVDIMLGNENGLKLAPIIREKTKAPIFYVSAKDSDADKLKGFLHGADDYVTKPFNPMELAARVKVQLQRYLDMKHSKQVLSYQIGSCLFNTKTAELQKDTHIEQLSGKMYHLLLYLCEHAGQVISRNQIYEHVWEDSYLIDDNSVMVYIRKLREKIEPEPSKPKYLKTIRGIGYKLQFEETI